jgi:DNA-binding SARP family transcriptional activator
MLEFRILGPLEVVRDGEPVVLGGQRLRAVLAFLLVHANELVPAERVVAEVWGEEAPRTATASLQNFVGQLRKLLGRGVLVTRSPGYVLQIDRDQLDAHRFERLVAEARSAPAAERARLLREALELWRGAPFADLPYEAFAQTEIRRLEEVCLGALEDHLDAQIEVGEHAAAITELERLVAVNPLRERLHSLLMLALYRAGRQAAALDAYQAARRALNDELGIDPGPALRQLHGAILRQDASLERRAATPSPAPAADHLAEVVRALIAGKVVPVLGSDAAPLASHLAEHFMYPTDEGPELPRVSQFVATLRGYGPLYDELHALVERDGDPTSVERLFAALPPVLRERGAPHQLLVTTAYGHSLERAFAEAGEEVDVVSYIASGRNRGLFCHQRPDGDARVIELPNTYASELSLDRRTVILKVHGQAHVDREWESFVVTEDDYIEYLGRGDVAGAIPIALAATLRRSHFLFLGYTMRDWNLRLVLGRIWGEQPAAYRSWAVHPQPRTAERELWRRVEVDLLELPLEAYAEMLSSAIGALNVRATA